MKQHRVLLLLLFRLFEGKVAYILSGEGVDFSRKAALTLHIQLIGMDHHN